MTHPRDIAIDAYDYPLPSDRIALHPLPERASSRLLIAGRGALHQDVFRNLADHLPSESLMVFNDSRVIAARVLFRKPTGATIEVFCLEPGPGYANPETALQQRGAVTWKCLVGNAAAWPPAAVLQTLLSPSLTLQAQIVSRENGYFLVQLSWTDNSLSFAEILNQAGTTPLPPYIRRKAEAADGQRYQTVYANQPGSVAAPTAGLHFDAAVLDHIRQKGIQTDFITLHVGAGTFKPVKTDTIGAHDMHEEWIIVKRSLLENINARADRPILAVGTTSLRALESIYWLGLQILEGRGAGEDALRITQWEPYEKPAGESRQAVLNAVLKWMEEKRLENLAIRTSLLIAPGYTFRMADILVTNFHQPRSTLLLLVAAFMGDNWKDIYAYALDNHFRFLSYGDACLFFRQ